MNALQPSERPYPIDGFRRSQAGLCRLKRWLVATVVLVLLTAPLPAHAQTVVINEILFHPGVGRPGEVGYLPEDTRKEFIELLNLESAPLNLHGWRFEKGVSFVFPPVTIEAGGFLVVAADPDVAWFKAAYGAQFPGVNAAQVIGGWNGKLSNRGETIELVNASGQGVDQVTFATQGDWAQRREGDPYPGQESWWRGWKWSNGADDEGRSLELINAHLPNEYGQNWAASRFDGGTPGGPNSMASLMATPFITRVRHRPAVPKSTDSVTVTAQLVPKPDPAVTVNLLSRVDGADQFSSTAMFDDGLHRDGVAGDGLFAAELAPQTDRTVVEFYIQAVASGEIRTWPGPTDDQGAQNANALYQVDNSVYTGSQPLYRLVIPNREVADWTRLMDETSGGRFSDATMHGTFICIDGLGTDIRYRVGVRNRGAGTRAARPHNLHIGFPDDEPWRGLGSLGLNTRMVHSQVAGNAFFSVAGLPTTQGYPAQVRVNGINLAYLAPTGSSDSYQFGSYYAFQPYGVEWAERRFPSDRDGNLYKAVWYLDSVRLDNNGGDLRYLGEDPASYRQSYSPTGPTSTTGAYSKHSNVSEDDWTDLIGLVRTLDTGPAATYLEAVSQVVNIDEWLRYFAVNTLAGNMETTLATGSGDDYWLYAGKIDRRFQVLSHDLDTVFGQGDTAPDYGRSIWRATRLPVVNRFLTHPAIARRYCAILKELANTVFVPERANALLEQSLGGWIPSSVIDNMKNFVAQRREIVLAQIASDLTVAHALPINVYPRTETNTVTLSGNSSSIDTHAVLVNGVPAVWAPASAAWTAENVSLNPGINRVVIRALGEDGTEFDRSSIDVWYDTGSFTTIPRGTLAADVVWQAAGGPHFVTGSVTVPAGVTLTIEPGTTVFFASGASLVMEGGRLIAEGTGSQRIRFTRLPGTNGQWSGLQFINGSDGASVLACTDIEFAGAQDQVILVLDARVEFTAVTLFNSDTRGIVMNRSPAVFRNCVFGEVGEHDLLTAEDARVDGGLVLEANLFASTAPGYDVVRLNRMGLVRMVDNVFLGSGSHILNASDTDLHIEGNLFMHANPGNATPIGSGAVSAGSSLLGGNGVPMLTHHVLVRNVFFENDYGLIARAGAFAELLHNVFVGNRGAILFNEPWKAESGPARGCKIDSSIFWQNQPEDQAGLSGTFVQWTNRAPAGHAQLSVNNSILPAVYHRFGAGNLDVDPRFIRPSITGRVNASAARFATGFDGFDTSAFLSVNTGAPDLRIQPGSPAIAAGFNGADIGYNVSSNATITGIPAEPTAQTTATAIVGGTDLAGYRYRLIGPGNVTNDWSTERASVKQVASITVSSGIATASVPGHGYFEGDRIQIWGAQDEAHNGEFAIFGITPDTFRYAVADSSGNEPLPGDVRCRKPEPIQLTSLAPGTYTLEVIRKNALGLWQPFDHPTTATWTIDPGAAPPIRLNEVLAHNLAALPGPAGTYPDAVEIVNDGTTHVDLGGMQLSESVTSARPFTFSPGTILGPGEHMVLWGGTATSAAGLQLGFELNRNGDALYLWDTPARGGRLLDSVRFGLQMPDYSIGRVNGSWLLTVPTFGRPNQEAALGSPNQLVLNEWLASARTLVLPEFIEVYNPGILPVALGGIWIRPDAMALPGGSRIPPLSFINGHGFAVFYPDNHPELGSDHLNFTLSSGPGAIGLVLEEGMSIDAVLDGPQTADAAEGRFPDGTSRITQMFETTPGAVNAGPRTGEGTVSHEHVQLLSFEDSWSYNDAGHDLGESWRFDAYDDSAWPDGLALLVAGEGDYPVRPGTSLSLENADGDHTVTFYFRTEFLVEANLPDATLEGRLVVDDGAIIYLNGERVLSQNMPEDSEPTYATRPLRTVGTADIEGPFVIPANKLRLGRNLLAAEVHQISDRSHDIAFAMELTATLAKTNDVNMLGRAPVRINEILARQSTASGPIGASDWIELSNLSGQVVDLAGFSLTDEPEFQRKWVFPSPTTLPPNGFLVLDCRSEDLPSTSNTGFGLNATGGALWLFAPPGDGGPLVDAVFYGLQAADLSVGRQNGREWALCTPTPGGANIPVPLGDPAGLIINEWMASQESGPDWFELFNPGDRPVALAGLSLNDDLLDPSVDPIPALSFIGTGPGAFQVFTADEQVFKGPDHVGFKLSAGGESIGLFGPDGILLDAVEFGPQTRGLSEGSLPDGGAHIATFSIPTPGAPNQGSVLRITAAGMTGNGFALSFAAEPQQAYSIQVSDSLSTGGWSEMQRVQASSEGGPVTAIDRAASDVGARYYRIVALTPEQASRTTFAAP
ncbi:MAG: lamin tail domain-containing protein [Verrucomicrobiia bacterium]